MVSNKTVRPIGYWVLVEDGELEELQAANLPVRQDRHGVWWLRMADQPTNPEHEWGPGPEW